jgi:hypothetical protein
MQARACRFADGRGNSGDRGVGVVFDIHTLIVDEVGMSRSWYAPEHGRNRATNYPT